MSDDHQGESDCLSSIARSLSGKRIRLKGLQKWGTTWAHCTVEVDAGETLVALFEYAEQVAAERLSKAIEAQARLREASSDIAEVAASFEQPIAERLAGDIVARVAEFSFQRFGGNDGA